MLFADLRRDFVNTWFKPLAEASFDDMEALYAAMEKQGADDLARGRAMTADLAIQRGADMRYVGQEHAVTVDIPMELFKAKDRDGIKKRFDAVHETRYGYSAPKEKAEIVSLRSATIGLMRKPEREAMGKAASPDAAARGKRPVYFSGIGKVETQTYDRALLIAGNLSTQRCYVRLVFAVAKTPIIDLDNCLFSDSSLTLFHKYLPASATGVINSTNGARDG